MKIRKQQENRDSKIAQYSKKLLLSKYRKGKYRQKFFKELAIYVNKILKHKGLSATGDWACVIIRDKEGAPTGYIKEYESDYIIQYVGNHKISRNTGFYDMYKNIISVIEEGR